MVKEEGGQISTFHIRPNKQNQIYEDRIANVQRERHDPKLTVN